MAVERASYEKERTPLKIIADHSEFDSSPSPENPSSPVASLPIYRRNNSVSVWGFPVNSIREFLFFDSLHPMIRKSDQKLIETAQDLIYLAVTLQNTAPSGWSSC